MKCQMVLQLVFTCKAGKAMLLKVMSVVMIEKTNCELFQSVLCMYLMHVPNYIDFFFCRILISIETKSEFT